MIVNAVLSFAIYANSGNGMHNCKKVMMDFYNDEEIKNAARSLWMACSKDLPKPFQNRRSTDNRQASAQYLEDIMDAIKRLDAKGKLPDVVTRDISRLPDRQPEQLNMLYVINEMAELKKASKCYEENLSNLKIDVLKLQDNAKNNCKQDEKEMLKILRIQKVMVK